MSRRRKGSSGWEDIDGGMGFVIPYTTLRHPNYRRLSPHGHKLLADLACQYTGFNNGYVCASWSLMRECGWRSSDTLYVAIRECEHYGLLIRTQQGGRNKRTLHAFSWRRINDKPNQPLDRLPTTAPPNDWKNEQPLFDPRPLRARMRTGKGRKRAASRRARN